MIDKEVIDRRLSQFLFEACKIFPSIFGIYKNEPSENLKNFFTHPSGLVCTVSKGKRQKVEKRAELYLLIRVLVPAFRIQIVLGFVVPILHLKYHFR